MGRACFRCRVDIVIHVSKPLAVCAAISQDTYVWLGLDRLDHALSLEMNLSWCECGLLELK